MKIVPEIVLFIRKLSKARRGQQVIIQVLIRRGGAPSERRQSSLVEWRVKPSSSPLKGAFFNQNPVQYFF
jgi:hypothetical protein